MSRRAGFTLIEVLVAVLVVGLVYGFLLEAVTDNIARVGTARGELEVAALAERVLREVQARAVAGEPITQGVEEGAFAPPDDAYRFRVLIEPYLVPLPPSFTGELPPSVIFAPASGAPANPNPDPPLIRIEVRAFAEDADPELAAPITVFVSSPTAGLETGEGLEPGAGG